MYTQVSEATRAKRATHLEAMREKFRREPRTVCRVVGKRTVKRTVEVTKPVWKKIVIDLSDLARACRTAKSMCKNPILIEHLEIAATYFDDAANAPGTQPSL